MKVKIQRCVVVWLVVSVSLAGVGWAEATFAPEDLEMIRAAKERGTKGLADAEILRFLVAFEKHEASEAMTLPNLFFGQVPPAETVAPKDPESPRDNPAVQRVLARLEKLGVDTSSLDLLRYELVLPGGRMLGGYRARVAAPPEEAYKPGISLESEPRALTGDDLTEGLEFCWIFAADACGGGGGGCLSCCFNQVSDCIVVCNENQTASCVRLCDFLWESAMEGCFEGCDPG